MTGDACGPFGVGVERRDQRGVDDVRLRELLEDVGVHGADVTAADEADTDHCAPRFEIATPDPLGPVVRRDR